MDCRRAERLMDELLDGDLGRSRRWALEGHLAQCERCAERFEQLYALDRLARRIEVASPGGDFVERVMARIGAEERKARLQAPARKGRWVAAAAPVAVVVLAGALGRWVAAVAGIENGLRFAAELASSALASFSESLSGATAGLAELWSRAERLQAAASASWLPLVAILSLAGLVAFNAYQARWTEQKR